MSFLKMTLPPSAILASRAGFCKGFSLQHVRRISCFLFKMQMSGLKKLRSSGANEVWELLNRAGVLQVWFLAEQLWSPQPSLLEDPSFQAPTRDLLNQKLKWDPATWSLTILLSWLCACSGLRTTCNRAKILKQWFVLLPANWNHLQAFKSKRSIPDQLNQHIHGWRFLKNLT